MQGEKNQWQNWAWNPACAQLLPVASPGMEGVYVRALLETGREKGRKQEMSGNQRLLHVLQMSVPNSSWISDLPAPQLLYPTQPSSKQK